MSDTTYTVTSKFKVDINDALDAMRKLADEPKKVHSAFGEMADKVKEGWDSLSENAEKFFFVIEAGKKVIEGLAKAFELAEFSAQLENLEKRMPVERIVAMQKATEDTVGRLDLMRFAMKAMNGEVHLTESGLSTVLEAAKNLNKEGFGETLDIAEKLTHAIRSGNIKALYDLGIQIDSTKDKHEKYLSVQEAIRREAEKVVPVSADLERVEQAKAAFDDFITNAKRGLGEIVLLLFEGIDKITGMTASKTTRATRDVRATQYEAMQYARQQVPGAPPQLGEENFDEAVLGMSVGAGSIGPRTPAQLEAINASAAFWAAEATYFSKLTLMVGAANVDQKAEEDAKKAKEALSTGKPPSTPIPKVTDGFSKLWASLSKHDEQSYVSRGAEEITKLTDTKDYRSPYQKLMRAAEAGSQQEKTDFMGQSMRDAFGGMGDQQAEQKEKMKEFGADLEDRTKLLGGAFGAMSSGMSAAVDAAITGSDNIGHAFMKASAMALKSLAIESTVRAAYFAAMGLGALWLAPPAAAGYFASSAQFALTAALAGAGAVILGGASDAFSTGSGAGGSAGVPGGGAATNSTAAAGPQAQNITVYVGDGFVGRPDELGKMISDKVNVASKTGRSTVNTTPSGPVLFRGG